MSSATPSARGRRLRTSLVWVGLLLGSVVTAAFLCGLWFGFGARAGLFAAALAFPGAVLGALGVASLALAVIAWVARAHRSARWGAVTVTAVILALFGTTVAGDPAPRALTDVPARSADAVRVFAWNVLDGERNAGAWQEAIVATDPDVVVLSEIYPRTAERLGVPDGYEVHGSPDIAVTVLTADRLGTYRVTAADESGTTSGITLDPVGDDSLPRIVGAHLVRITPTGDDGFWHRGLNWVSAQCTAGNTVIAGDLNAGPANLRSGLGTCTDIAATGGSWPTGIPWFLGAAIDHVMTTPDWHATMSATVDLPGNPSDHRAVVADLTRP